MTVTVHDPWVFPFLLIGGVIGAIFANVIWDAICKARWRMMPMEAKQVILDAAFASAVARFDHQDWLERHARFDIQGRADLIARYMNEYLRAHRSLAPVVKEGDIAALYAGYAVHNISREKMRAIGIN